MRESVAWLGCGHPRDKSYSVERSRLLDNAWLMITTPTVFILGAGASAPHKFDTGETLLRNARNMAPLTLMEYIKPLQSYEATPLRDALINTGDLSIDAMLETRRDIQNAGKMLMARMLLHQERNALGNLHVAERDWYGTLFTAMDAPTVEAALAQKVTFITYNYDRSLEYRLAHAWRVKFDPHQLVHAPSIQRMFIHLHGQLGFLPEVGGEGGMRVPYGGSAAGITDGDVLEAKGHMKIVSEPHPDEPQFIKAREALSQAERVVFLGFGFAPRNLERLQLETCLKETAAIYACAKGFSSNGKAIYIQRPLQQRWRNRTVGEERDDAREFLRLWPDALT
jgi:hypothetical protein